MSDLSDDSNVSDVNLTLKNKVTAVPVDVITYGGELSFK